MMKWVTGFLRENQERWESEKKQKEIENKKELDTWERSKRFEKIAILRKKIKDTEKGENMEISSPDKKGNVEDNWKVWRKTSHENDEILKPALTPTKSPSTSAAHILKPPLTTGGVLQDPSSTVVTNKKPQPPKSQEKAKMKKKLPQATLEVRTRTLSTF